MRRAENPNEKRPSAPSDTGEEQRVSSPIEPGTNPESGTAAENGPVQQPRSGSHAAHSAEPGASTPPAGSSAEVPPWQRAANRPPTRPPADPPARPAGEAFAGPPVAPPVPRAGEVTETIDRVRPADARPTDSVRPDARPTDSVRPDARTPPPAAAALDSRASRAISGIAAPAPFQQPKTPAGEPDLPAKRAEVARSPEIASELPDLSGPAPRPVQQKPENAAVARTSRIEVAPGTTGGPVRASMQIRRIDPWSALKVSLLLSVALFFVWMIAVAFLYLVLGGMGVWSKLNSNVGDLLTSTNAGGELVSAGSVFGGALLIGLLNIVLLTALATIGAFIYNLTTDIVGGVEVTLADRD